MSTELSLFDSVALTARKLTEEFKNPDDDWDPMVFFENETKESLPIWPCAQFMESDATKDLMANLLLPMMIKQFQATRVVMVMSVWMADVAKEVDPYTVRASQHPNRKEMVLLLEITSAGVSRHAFANIIRHESSPPTLEEWEEYEFVDGFVGRFVDPAVRAFKEV